MNRLFSEPVFYLLIIFVPLWSVFGYVVVIDNVDFEEREQYLIDINCYDLTEELRTHEYKKGGRLYQEAMFQMDLRC